MPEVTATNTNNQFSIKKFTRETFVGNEDAF